MDGAGRGMESVTEAMMHREGACVLVSCVVCGVWCARLPSPPWTRR